MAIREPSLKLLVNKATKKILFAEAGKDFTDFLFSLLAMPIGTVVQLLKVDSMVGSVGNIYSSLKSLSCSYLKPSMDKDQLLSPRWAGSSLLQLKASPEPDPNPQPAAYYRCSQGCSESNNYHSRSKKNCGSRTYVFGFEQPTYQPHKECDEYITGVSGTLCPCCNHSMTSKLTVVPEGTVQKVAPKVTISTAAGYVQDVVTYMVMDDLSVSPMSTISSVALLNRFNIHDVGCLEERTVKVSMEQGLAILKAALQSKTVLSDVFIRAKTSSA